VSGPVHTEIERKFLVTGDGWRAQVDGPPVPMRAGYLSRRAEATIRVRFEGDEAVLTIKGRAVDADGRERAEYNVPVPADQAAAILAGAMLEGGVVRKTRWPVRVGGSLWTVDVFEHPRPGVALAEIELPTRDAPFDRPDWVGEEVTGDPHWTNAMIAQEA